MQNLRGDNKILNAITVCPATYSEVPPVELLDAITLLGKKSLSALFYDYDTREELTHEFAKGFNSIFNYILNQIEPAPEQFQKWIAMFSWFKRTLKEWTRQEDPNDSTLISLLLVAQFCQKEESFWKDLPSEIVISDALLRSLSELLAGLAIPNYETASLEWPILRDAERSKDWVAMDAALRSLSFPQPTIFQIQITDILSRYSPDALEDAISSQHQVVMALQQQELLTLNQSLKIGTNTKNSLIQFATLLKILSPDVQELSSEQYDATTFLQKLSQTPREWSSALAILVSSPRRSTHLNSAMAKVLANGTTLIQPAFIKHLNIISNGGLRTCVERQTVSALLKEFHKIAPENIRLSLWRGLHEKWVDWRFGTRNEGRTLHELSWSAIDYACVGYAVECITETELKLKIQKIEQNLLTLHHQWFRSVVPCKSEWFVLLSQLKIYKHASKVGLSDDWSFNDSAWDYDAPNLPYIKLKWE
ncbi:hypothetical protein PGC34_11645 [Pseudomonas kribbensis]|uniref:hypothetical protein n=1 Tax=Pseudomonas kribbensis TaxID=1628086 RepID=UPI003BF8F4AF